MQLRCSVNGPLGYMKWNFSSLQWSVDWTLVLRVQDSKSPCFRSLFAPLSKALHSNCSVVRRSRKAAGPISSISHSLSDVRKRHRLSYGCSKKVGESSLVRIKIPSKYITALGPEWGKGGCSQIEFPAVIVNATYS